MMTAQAYRSSDFTYHQPTRTLVTEASQVGYRDQAEIAVRSEKTGAVKVFAFVKRETDAEGETLAWRFIARDGSGLQVSIVND